MRFISSLALLSLAGLGLATPTSEAINRRQHDAPAVAAGSDSHGIFGALSGRGDTKSGNSKNKAKWTPCLHQNDVDILVDAYVRMISHWNDDDAKYLTDDFIDTSDSINILAGIPLGSPTFSSKQAFIDHQHTQPDNLPLVITHKSPYSCTEMAVIWQATFGVAQKQVRGISIAEATKENGFWQIKRIDVEFNSLAYLLDMGGSYKMPGQ
ncbi:hypothetical protein C8A03DRAFT_31842 [Achaetomium macrosporum]|uniref:NTF2-like domain-containing protein n=1 Tax=Achaetomium macrosporum TaxID=79813 RepID=A0AAN7CDK8_9PEZI|nr:hypothetical protein C8A03DRAFT_31842 [Achaetomium macrosporum]